MTSKSKPGLILSEGFCALLLVAMASGGSFAQVSSVHEFVTETARCYDNALVTDGTYLYGVRYDGHVDGHGAIFRVGMGGDGFEVIHVFEGTTHGYNPVGTLAISGTTLYGMTLFGGAHDLGTIFKIQTDGSGFQTLLDFDGSNGALPYTSLLVSDNVLYGATNHGVFRLNSDGSDYQELLTFHEGMGMHPQGALTISGDTLFGVSNRGGTSDLGVIYQIRTNGAGHRVIFNFRESTGYNPYGGLIVSGTTLFGTTGQGGPGPASGSPFKININGTGFHSFAGLMASNPNGTLTLADSILYGMTSVGGYASGVIYSLDLRDSSYTTLHEFNITDGENPSGSLLLASGQLYGYVPGGNHGYGVIFRIEPDGQNFTILKDFEATNSGYDPRGGLVFTTERAYGITTAGGTHNCGVIYSIRHDGTGYQVVHNFERAQGKQPETSLTLSDSLLYGVTLLGGSDYDGVMFRIDTTGENFEILHHFNFAEGSFPSGSLVDSGDEFLYGVASAGGLTNEGTVFRFNKKTEQMETLLDFSTVDGHNPRGTMVLADTILYGFALGGVGDGIVFSVKTDGADFTKLVDKTSDLAGRYGNSMALKDSVLYVTMSQGGMNDFGVLFSVETDGSDFEKLFDFTNDGGGIPEGAILVTDTLIYGMTQIGGPDNTGAAYSINLNGTGYVALFTFAEEEESASGRISSTTNPSSAFGSISVFDDFMYAAVTSQNLETGRTTGTIHRYALHPIVTGITPEREVTVTAFPNPTADYITITGLAGKSFVLMDSSGRKLNIEPGPGMLVDITALPPGIYFLLVDGKVLRIVKR